MQTRFSSRHAAIPFTDPAGRNTWPLQSKTARSIHSHAPGSVCHFSQCSFQCALSLCCSYHVFPVSQSALSLSYKVSISLLSLSLCLHGQGRQPVCNRPKFDGAEWDYEEQDHVGGKCMTPFTDGDIRELVDGLYLSQPCSLGLILSESLPQFSAVFFPSHNLFLVLLCSHATLEMSRFAGEYCCLQTMFTTSF